MRRFTIAILASTFLACAQISALNPFGGITGGPAQAFGIAKAGYIAAFESAARYVVICQQQPPTLECDELGELVFDKVNPQARQNIALGDAVAAGLITPEMACIEETDPGCTERNRAKQLEMLSQALQQAAVMLNSRR